MKNNLISNFYNTVPTIIFFTVLIRTDTKKIGQRQKWLLINIFHFSSDFDESWWDCSTDEYYNVTNFHQNWMKNRNLLLHACFWLCPIFFVSDLRILYCTIQLKSCGALMMWFLKNSEGNKKAGEFFSKYGWGNIVKSFINLFQAFNYFLTNMSQNSYS